MIHVAVAGAVAMAAVAVIVWQQLVRTPWGLPGHRGVFWFSTLIASRWIIDRPGTAIRIAATSSCLILVIDPAVGVQVVPYLIVALLVDRVARRRRFAASRGCCSRWRRLSTWPEFSPRSCTTSPLARWARCCPGCGSTSKVTCCGGRPREWAGSGRESPAAG